MRKIFIAVFVMSLLAITVKADAASSIRIVPGGNGVYYVRAVDFGEIGGVEIEIQYDPATLANPQITQGSMLASTMFIPNVRFSLSSVKIAAMSLTSIKGSGDLAVITFEVKGENPRTPAVVRSKLAASTGTSVKHDTPATASVEATNTIRTPNTTRTPDTTSPSDTSGGGTYVSGGYSVGTITLPQDQAAASEAGNNKTDNQPLVTDLRKDMTLPLGGSGSQQNSGRELADEPGKEKQKKFETYMSIVQLFKDFRGDKSPNSLIPLFAENSVPGFKQEPPIAFSDGQTPLKITVTLKQAGSDSPKFMLQGANVKQLSGDGEGAITWTIEAVPKKDVVEVILTVINGQTVMEVPLAVAPRINALLAKGKVLSEADFAAYLAKPAKFDLNKDGKFDGVDDYIYTANYIVAMKIKPEKAKKEEAVVVPKPGAKDDPKSKESLKVKEDKVKAVEKTSEMPAVKPAVKP